MTRDLLWDKTSILIVDDIEDNLIALEAVLDPMNLNIVRARSGPEAMKSILRQEFAVVLLDVVMPGMDGFETASNIKRLDQTKDLSIIFLTGAEKGMSHAYRGFATGAVDYITKPFDPWVLRAKVAVFLELYHKKRQLDEMLTRNGKLIDEFEDQISFMGERLRAHVGAHEKEISNQYIAQLGHMLEGLREWLDDSYNSLENCDIGNDMVNQVTGADRSP